MTTTLTHSRLLVGRSLRTLSRQPAYLLFTLVQPMVWLLLFGQLFRRVADLPGFGAASYLTYLTPGVVVMTAMMSAGWSGTAIVQDMQRGVMDRTLTSPVRRSALVGASLSYQGLVTVAQALIMFGTGLVAGARYGSFRGVAVVLACAVLVAVIFAGLSDTVALLVHEQEALIAVSQFLVLPLVFLSSVMIAPALMPDWVARAARFNPVDWAAVASREALGADPDWGAVSGRMAMLAALAAVMAWLATRAYRRYRRSV